MLASWRLWRQVAGGSTLRQARRQVTAADGFRGAARVDRPFGVALLGLEEMPTEPFGWNVIVIGAWNMAILTPDGVRRRLFQVEDGIPLEVQIAVDSPGQFRVAHDGILVAPTATRLELAPQKPEPESLARAAELACRALHSLPETPVSAAGVNIRFRFAELPDKLLDLVRAQVDGSLADAGFKIAGATTKRTLAHDPGVINLQVKQEDVGGTLEFNCHRDSKTHGELSEWIRRVPEFVEVSTTLLKVLGIADA